MFLDSQPIERIVDARQPDRAADGNRRDRKQVETGPRDEGGAARIGPDLGPDRRPVGAAAGMEAVRVDRDQSVCRDCEAAGLWKAKRRQLVEADAQRAALRETIA